MHSFKSLTILTCLLFAILAQDHVQGNLDSNNNNQLNSKRWSNHAKHLFRKTKRQAPGQTVPVGITVNEPPSGTTLSQQIINQASTNPVGASELVQQIPYIADNSSGVTQLQYQLVSGDSNEAQLPWNSNVPFVQGAVTTANAEGGWQMIPEVEGFTLNRTWEIVPGAVMPFYSTANIDPTQIKRAVIAYPGEPRDAWLYAALYSNALEVVYYNQTYGVEKGSVLIITPFWGNQLDYEAGGLKPGEIFFYGDGWMAGEDSIGPNLTQSLTAYEIMDNFTDMLFDRAQYPNLNQVVIAGHSMGGQAAQKYAVLKKVKTYDPNMSWWVANPGSWAFLSADRPYYNASCNDTYNTWEYGLGQNLQNMTKYARDAVANDLNGVVRTYLNRRVHYSLGLLDNGAGDTHCEAMDQGGNHLDRGSQFAIHVYQVNNNSWPSSQTVDFVGNTSHQDFAMISANSSINWMFVDNYNTRLPDLNANNLSSAEGGQSSNSKSSSNSKNAAEALTTGLSTSFLFISILFGLVSLNI